MRKIGVALFLVVCTLLSGLLAKPVLADPPAVEAGLLPATEFTWVDPGSAFVMNGELVWTEVRFDLWGHAGVEAWEMARGLGLHFPKPEYRDHAPFGVKLEDRTFVQMMPGTCKFVWSRDCFDHTPEVDKVWFHSGNLNRFVVISWEDTFWNGQRMGDGFYKRNGKRFVRFDEVAPAFGGFVRQDSRGLVFVDMPPRVPGFQAAEACALNRQIETCNLGSLLVPEAVGTRGDEDVFWLLGYEADTGGKDGVYGRLFRLWNQAGLRYDGRKPAALDIVNESIDKVAILVSTTYLIDAGVDAMMWRYLPIEAMKAAQFQAERESRIAAYMAAKVAPAEVAKAAENVIGDVVLPEGSRPPDRGFFYLVRSFRNPAPANFQQTAAGTFIRPIPGYPGKYLVREFGTRVNGYWMDNYVCGECIEAKGYYDFLVKDGRINPSFYKRPDSAVPELVKELRTHVRETLPFDDNVHWVFDGSAFMDAFKIYLKEFESDLYELLDSRIFFSSI
ncbi:MAG TPA: hypothetical protein VGK74_13850 [Symbiobacteriaceae bacterium]